MHDHFAAKQGRCMLDTGADAFGAAFGDLESCSPKIGNALLKSWKLVEILHVSVCISRFSNGSDALRPTIAFCGVIVRPKMVPIRNIGIRMPHVQPDGIGSLKLLDLAADKHQTRPWFGAWPELSGGTYLLSELVADINAAVTLQQSRRRRDDMAYYPSGWRCCRDDEVVKWTLDGLLRKLSSWLAKLPPPRTISLLRSG
ncbi:hypothetical protein EJ06DRAFT_344537 [Trichodelitschia bisporula]|uniref:Uncharacterized protein n=1 Tax=Trichodelitschia bisporula TaxID=703511 RepID=A0A6G1I380_9PEZI|nr:hypothetical protein EJ06DRAFT_344537 [Trichodelitschia bisporula]